MMKTLMLVFALALTSLSTNDWMTIQKDKVAVRFNHQMEFNDLVKIKLDLAEAGITIHYEKLVFDRQHKLTEIAFAVDCNDGFSGGAATGNLYDNSEFGFLRDYKGPVPFATGGLD